MASVNYYVVFGSGNPVDNQGLSPTFISFKNQAGGSTTAPSIAEIGASTGIYTFAYECTGSINFVVDGATTGLADADRFVVGSLDINDRNNEFIQSSGVTLVAVGNTLSDLASVGIGSTLFGLIGNTSSLIGDNATSPTTVFGFIKRIREWTEGQSNYVRATGVWTTLDTSGDTTLAVRTITDNGSIVTKS